MSKLFTPLISLAMGAAGAAMFAAVTLQPSTPGTKETGNINVSGTVIGGKILAGLNSSASIITAYTADPSTTGIQSSSKNFAMRGQATTTSGLAYGGYFDATSPDGYGIWVRNKSVAGAGIAVLGETSSPTGIGGKFLATAESGLAYGVRGEVMTQTPDAVGVLGVGTKNIGVRGEAKTGAGWGVQGTGAGRGVYGFSSTGVGAYGASNANSQHGVVGLTNGGGAGHAVFANGTLSASGTKSMMIDHPDDPQNKYLLQFCAEGDTPQLYYRGSIKLDSAGSAVVHLPSYFDKINKDPICQLTAVGAAMPSLHVAEEVQNNRFKIAGGKAGSKVYWTVIGIRNDKYVQKYGALTERDKPREKVGTYLQPELYGQPVEMRESYDQRDPSASSNVQNPPKRR